jgi:hypothetical protein
LIYLLAEYLMSQGQSRLLYGMVEDIRVLDEMVEEAPLHRDLDGDQRLRRPFLRNLLGPPSHPKA